LLLFLTFSYKLKQYSLLYRYVVYKQLKKIIPPLPAVEEMEWPLVTIQLPVYNEGSIALNALRAISRLDYPVNNLHLQILDDSDDNTATVLRALSYELKQSGVDIDYIYRDKRVGYKGGALANGLLTAKGKYIAIFDADFLPDPIWLKQVLMCFYKADSVYHCVKPLGMIQTGWHYRNADRNLITRGASSLMDSMFRVRKFVNSFEHRAISFNGSSGLFLRECLIDAGGWNSTAVVEDTDLSVRIQTRDMYDTLFVGSISCEAILPERVREFRQQQFRWTYGTHVTLLKEILSNLKQRKLFDCMFSLVNWSTINLVQVILTIVGATLLFNGTHLLLSCLSLLLCIPYSLEWPLYYIASKQDQSAGFALRRASSVPLLGVATSLHNSLAVILATFSVKIKFMRLSRAALKKKKEKTFALEDWATSFFPGALLLNVAYVAYYRMLHTTASPVHTALNYFGFCLCTLLGVLYSSAFFLLRE
jgi:cellulose synthase/poly-beta-1,6-N-acetylglucosamine synthase-like glycosyltransferase